ncbi:TonB-dependent receptor [Calothrix sp. PCC 7507]|uniref:TonB-dependent receptor n=1 Tax=Calothrix sp. PCC 7507 TaxID=99598 RepID=UPI0002EB8C85|nr:TonB-dependent receptor [Calothrix sp. PCC 7507]
MIGGRVYASTVAITSAGPGYAVAGAGAGANGQTTYTNAQTNTTVQDYGNIISSTSNAQATAYGRTGNQIARSSSDSTSIWFSISN